MKCGPVESWQVPEVARDGERVVAPQQSCLPLHRNHSQAQLLHGQTRIHLALLSGKFCQPTASEVDYSCTPITGHLDNQLPQYPAICFNNRSPR